MNNKLRGILLAILGLGLLGAGAVAVYFLFMQANQAPVVVIQPTPISTVKSQVVVVSHDVFLGQLLTAEDLTVVEVPAELVPRDAVVAVDEAVAKFVKVDLVQGEMVLRHNLADPTNVNHDLAFILAEDHVLLAIPANDLMSSLSIIKTGDLVDIFATMTLPVNDTVPTTPQVEPTQGTIDTSIATVEEPPTEQTVTLDVYQKLNITAVIADIVYDEGQEPSATESIRRDQITIRAYLVALPAQEALVLKYLMDMGGQFDFVIRNPTSTTQFELTPITATYLRELWGLGLIPQSPSQ